MRPIPDQLKSRNLVPFKKGPGRYKIPGLASDHDVMVDRVDADLSPEEQGFIRHYLGYADSFLRSVEHIVPDQPEEPAVQTEIEAAGERNPERKEPGTIKAA